MAHAKFRFEVCRRRGGESFGEFGFQAGQIFGMHPRVPLVETVGHFVIRITQLAFPAARKRDRILFHIPLPEAGSGDPDGQLEECVLLTWGWHNGG